MECASGKSGTEEDPAALFVGKQVEFLRRAFAEKEKRGLLLEHSSSKGDATAPRIATEGELVLYIKEAESKSIDDALSSEYEVIEWEDVTNPADMDIQALGYKEDSEPNGNVDVVDTVYESECVETAASKDRSLDTREEYLVKQVILSNEMAEEVLLVLETMDIRLVQSESKFFGELKMGITETQKYIDRATKLLRDFPPVTSPESRTDFILEVGQYVKSVFCCLEDLSRKLVELHAREMCGVVDDLKEGLKPIVPLDQSPIRAPSVKKEAVSLNNVFMLEAAFVAVAAVLFCLVLLLFEDHAVTGAIVEFFQNAT